MLCMMREGWGGGYSFMHDLSSIGGVPSKPMEVNTVLRRILTFCACFVSGFIMFTLLTLTVENHVPTLTLTSISSNREGVVVRVLNSEAMTTNQANCTLEYCRERLSPRDTEDFFACTKKANVAGESKATDNCLFLSPRNRPLVALASFPGSGNTWVRGLLQKATRVCTGATYCDISLRVQGFPAEGVSSPSTLVVKTHNPYPHWAKRGTVNADSKDHWSNAILLVRNPFDALVSEWNRRQANLGFVETKVKTSHTDSVGPEFFGTNKEWDKFVREKAPLWLAMMKQFLVINWHHPVLVVSYELLRNDTSQELRRMLDFLQVTYDQASLERTVDSDFKTFHRGKAEFEHYTKSQAQLVKSLIADAKNMLTQNRKYFLQFLPLDDYLHTKGVVM